VILEEGNTTEVPGFNTHLKARKTKAPKDHEPKVDLGLPFQHIARCRTIDKQYNYIHNKRISRQDLCLACQSNLAVGQIKQEMHQPGNNLEAVIKTQLVKLCIFAEIPHYALLMC